MTTEENFRDLEINEQTKIRYSPDLNLLHICHKEETMIIPGASKVIDFLNDVRIEHTGIDLNKIHDAHE